MNMNADEREFVLSLCTNPSISKYIAMLEDEIASLQAQLSVSKAATEHMHDEMDSARDEYEILNSEIATSQARERAAELSAYKKVVDRYREIENDEEKYPEQYDVICALNEWLHDRMDDMRRTGEKA